MLYILPYKTHSKGYRLLRTEMGITPAQNKKVMQEFVTGSTIINWGNRTSTAQTQLDNHNKMFNHPRLLNDVSNKIKFFGKISKKVRTPEWTVDQRVALEWLKEGHEVLGRSATGSGGKDICFGSEDADQFLKSEFWVKYKKKKDEYRVHIGNGKVFDYQKKALRNLDEDGDPIDTSQVDYRVRNHSGGFIFKRQDVSPPDDVLNQSMRAMDICGLDFGAVDCIWNEHEQKAYVLEINSAPGLEGSTVKKYGDMFREMISKCA